MRAMSKIYLIALMFAVGCGSDGPQENGDVGGAGAGEDAGGDAGGDAGEDAGAGGDAGAGEPCGEVGGPSTDDPLSPISHVLVEGGITSAELSADGASVITCEAGAAKSRSLADLSDVSDHPGACPGTPPKQVQIGARTVAAAGPRGLRWGGAEVDTHGPVYALASTGDGDHAVTASWDAVYLWDLGDPDRDYQRARDVLPSGPVLGVIAAGDGKAFAWGPDGGTLLAVDTKKLAPDVKVDTRTLLVLCYDDGSCEGGMVLQNGGGAPLDIYSATIEGPGLSVEVEHSGFDDPPDCVLARAFGISGALVTVRLEGGPPAAEQIHQLTLKTNDPDEPDFIVNVVTGDESLANGDPTPDFRLPDLTGEVHQLSKLLGKVVHIKYLNAACVSCREAIPVLETGVWTPLRETAPDFEAFVLHVGRGTRFAAATNDDLDVIVPMLLDLDGAHFQIASQVAKGSLAYPLGLLVDKEGKVRHLVADDEPTPEQWREWIDALLAE